MWLCGAAVKVFAGSYWRPIKVCGWTDEFQGTVDEDSSIPFFHWKMLAKKVYGCHRLLSCLYRNVSGEQGAGCLKGIKPNCNSLSNETSGEWAETTLRAIPKRISICIFFFMLLAEYRFNWKWQKLVGRAHWNVSHSKGRRSLCFSQNLLIAITAESSGPMGGWSGENLLLLHHLFWGKIEAQKCVSQSPECMQNPIYIWCQWAEAVLYQCLALKLQGFLCNFSHNNEFSCNIPGTACPSADFSANHWNFSWVH